VVPVKDFLDQTILERGRIHQAAHHAGRPGALKPAFEQLGAMGFDQVAISRYPQVERIHTCTTPAIRRASSTARPPC
jgi:acetyl-CoA C-acetyltransferase